MLKINYLIMCVKRFGKRLLAFRSKWDSSVNLKKKNPKKT